MEPPLDDEEWLDVLAAISEQFRSGDAYRQRLIAAVQAARTAAARARLLERQLTYLREAMRETLGLPATDDVDALDANIIDLAAERLRPA